MTASHCPQHINDVNLPSHHISEGSCHHDSRTEFEIILAVQHGTQINPFACFAGPRVQNPKIFNEITFVKKGRFHIDCPTLSFPINSLVDKVATPPQNLVFVARWVFAIVAPTLSFQPTSKSSHVIKSTDRESERESASERESFWTELLQAWNSKIYCPKNHF